MTVAGFRSLKAARQAGQLRDKRTEPAVHRAQARAFDRALKHVELMAESKNLDLHADSAAQGGGEKRPEGRQNRGWREPAQVSHFQLHPSLRDAQFTVSRLVALI